MRIKVDDADRTIYLRHSTKESKGNCVVAALAIICYIDSESKTSLLTIVKMRGWNLPSLAMLFLPSEI